jgi:hypothetical protein
MALAVNVTLESPLQCVSCFLFASTACTDSISLKTGFLNWLSGHPGHMVHSCGKVPATRQLSIEQLDILDHETTKYTPNDLLLLFIKDLLVMGNQYFGGQVKYEILVAQGQPHLFWISDTLKRGNCHVHF